MDAYVSRRGPVSAGAKKPVLVVLHQEHSTPGRVGRVLTEKGYLLDIRRPRFDDPLPKTMADHAGAVIFGGPMSANDADEFIKVETDWIGLCLKEATPFLGICLGAQMLCRHLGGQVAPHADGHAEIGYYGLEPTEEGRAFAQSRALPWPRMVYQWHSEGFETPPGACCLATGATFPVQAIKVGEAAFGIQFHPDVTHAMMHRWTTRGAHRLDMPNARPREEHFEGWFQYDSAVALWLSGFLDHWLSQGLSQGVAQDGRETPCAALRETPCGG